MIYIDGVACTGKTTFLKKLKSDGVSVGLLDYFEFLQNNPLLGDLTNSMYSAWLANHHQWYDVIDRSLYSNMLYNFIFKLMGATDDEYDNIVDCLTKFLKNLRPLNGDKIYILLVREEQFAAVVENMERRNNGIDVLTIDYVKTQNFVFDLFADCLGLKKVYIDVYDFESSYKNLYDEIKNIV